MSVQRSLLNIFFLTVLFQFISIIQRSISYNALCYDKFSSIKLYKKKLIILLPESIQNMGEIIEFLFYLSISLFIDS